MVLYEFACNRCGRVEKRCHIGTLETDCPHCGDLAPRVFSFSINVHIVPSYHEALEETSDLMRKGKI